MLNYNALLQGIGATSFKNLQLFLLQKTKLEKIGKYSYSIFIENLEKDLFEKGKAFLIYENEKIKVITPEKIQDNFIIFNGKKYYEFDENNRKTNEFIIIFDNSLKISKQVCLIEILELMSKTHNDLQQNINNNKVKFLINSNETMRGEYEELTRNLENKEQSSVVVPTSKFTDEVQITQLQSTLNVSEYLTVFNFYNELRLSFLGIPCDKADKTERLITSEEEDRNKSLDFITNDEIACRKNALEKLKNMCGVSVEIYEI